MRAFAVVAVVAATGLVAAVLAATGAGSPATAAAAEVVLAPAAGSGVHGVGLFRHRGRRLTGWVGLAGLRPRTSHAVHFHGPGRCGRKAPAVAAHADLLADANGVAFARFRTVSASPVVRGRFYYNVHALPSTAGENPEVACGNLARVR